MAKAFGQSRLYVAGESRYKNNSFKLTLSNVPSNCLRPIADFFDGILPMISDTKVKIANIYLLAYDNVKD